MALKKMQTVKIMGRKISLSACLAEFVGMTLFVMIGCGSAMGIQGSGTSGGSGGDEEETTGGDTTSMIPGWVLMVAMVFGLSITTLAYSIGHYSGGQLNCAVTLGLVLTGYCDALQGILNFGSQMLGSISGAAILMAIFPPELDMTGALGSNSVGPKWNWWNALIGEAMCTALLVFVVLQTACNPKSEMNRSQACIAIGFAVFMGHCFMIPIDGCSINPTRSFGPALLSLTRLDAAKAEEPAVAMVGEVVAQVTTIKPTIESDVPAYWSGMWIFWLGPLLGACLAAAIYKIMLFLDSVDGDAADLVHEKVEQKETESSESSESRPLDV